MPLILKQDLFKTNGFCGMNVTNQIRRTHQHGHRHQQGADVQQHNPTQMKLHGNRTDIVCGRIQLERLKEILDDAERQSDNIPPAHAPPDEEDRERQEYLPNGSIVGPQRFQDSNHLRTFENDNQQARNHSKARHSGHQNQDDPHVRVEQVQPGKNLRIEFFRRA